jgi:hypothetical protein
MQMGWGDDEACIPPYMLRTAILGCETHPRGVADRV